MRPFFARCCAYKLFYCVMKATTWKVKVANMVAMLMIWAKIQKRNVLQITIPLRKSIQLKVYSHPVKNVWIGSLTLILIFFWIELVILESHKKVYQNYIFNSGDISGFPANPKNKIPWYFPDFPDQFCWNPLMQN